MKLSGDGLTSMSKDDSGNDKMYFDTKKKADIDGYCGEEEKHGRTQSGTTCWT